jgi:beta-lactam-binding protein with PASTA domain
VSSKATSEGPEATRILLTISRRLAMVVVLALAFLLSATVTIYLLFRIGDTRVPSLVGKTEGEAQKMAEKAGLKVKIQRRSDAHIPENTVIETRPAPNSSVKKDSNVTIVVSSGATQKSQLTPLPGYQSLFGLENAARLASDVL